MRVFRALPSSLLPLLLSVSSLTYADVSLIDEAGSDVADDGLRIEHTAGPTTCARPTQQGDTIAVHYRGRLQANGVEFDASYRRGKPLTFVLGVGRVIAGWDEGLLGMCVGEARTLTIPPALAYGSGGAGPIPPDATLVFETRLEALVSMAPGSEVVVTTSTSTSTSATTSASATDAAAFTIATAPSTPPPQEDVDMENTAEEEAGAEEEEKWETMEDAALEEANDQVPAEIVVPATNDSERGECKLLGPFALLVQGALGALALLTLVWKRWREEPKRPWKIFCFDVSKQVLGSMLTHVINLAMSMVGSGDIQNAAANAVSQGGEAVLDAAGHTPNPCSFYLLNLGIDTTIGVPVLYVLLKILTALFLYTPLARPPQSIKSGNYGTPPKTSWYGKQLLIYCIGLIGMKLFVFFLFMALPWLPWIGDWALRWTKGNEALEITFALFIFPLAMNAVQYWVIDNFIMDKQTGDLGYEQVAEDDADEERQRVIDDDDGPVDEEDTLTVGKSASSSQSRGTDGDGRGPRSDRSKLA